MQLCKYSTHPTATRAGILPGMLLVALSVFSATPARAQAASAASHPSPNSNSSTFNTPKQVAAGTAKLVQAYDPASKLRLAISIKAPKMAEEEAFLKELQDRNSPNFKKYLTPKQWNTRFAPSEQDEQAVVDWATSQGLTVLARYPNRLMVNVEGTVDTIQKAFNININRYEVNGAVEFSNDRDPQIPAYLQGTIEYVDGLNSILRMRPANSNMKGVRGPDYSPGPFRQNGADVRTDGVKAAAKSAAKSARPEKDGSQITNGYLDPSDILSSNLYNYDALMAQGHCCNPLGNSGGSPVQTTIGLATDGDFANSDVLSFASQYGLQFQGYRVYVGGTPSCCDDETTLDFEWSSATSNSFISPAESSTLYVYQAAKGFGDFGSVFNQMVSDNVVRVVNISYGLNESYLNGLGLVNSWHSIFNQMLGQGMTIMAAAGDNGATAGCGDSISLLYPGSDPDVVSVGGTQVELYSNGAFYSEVAWTGGTTSGSCSANNGGTGGGCSALFAAPGYQSSPACGSGSRSVPDVALNAATGQNYFFNGSLQGVGGTSISSPMMSGFIAQANAYLLAIGLGGAPVGEVNYKLYYAGEHTGNSYEAHYPFYDVTQGCNSNDITAEYGIGSYCAGTGYDLTTGWGSFNALQLSWAINTYDLGDFTAPSVNFSGPLSTIGGDTWFRTDQTVSFTVTDNGGNFTPTGVAGFSKGWDIGFSDPTSEATPGSGNSFYSGPQYPNGTSGTLDLASAGQGCHYATVDAWDNSGFTSGNKFYYYLCYDTIAPTVGASTSPGPNPNGWHNKPTTVTITASDPGGSTASGIAKTYYSVDSTPCSPTSIGTCTVYGSPVGLGTAGHRTINYFTEDVAGNFSAVVHNPINIDEVAPVTKGSLSGTLSGSDYITAVKVTLSATDDISGVQTTSYTLDGGSAKIYSAPFTVSSVGSHTVKFFSVDKAGNTETTKTVGFAIKSPTTTTLTVTPTGVVAGSTLTLKAVVSPSLSGTPTGNVVFKHGGTVIGTVALSGGAATFTTTGLPVGSYSLTASYGGATYFVSSVSPAVTESVLYKTAMTVTATPNPSHLGQNVTFTAKVTASGGAVPTGTVTFAHGTVSMGSATLNSSGIATFTTNSLSLGGHTIWVNYLGSSTDHSTEAPGYTMTVDQATTTTSIASSPNPAKAGQTITFSAKVTAATGPTATGTVTFRHGNTVIGTGTLNSSGIATVSTPSLAAGQYSVTAAYNGTTDDAASVSAALVQTVNK